MHLLYCKHSDFYGMTGDITDLICTAINNIVPNEAIGAQKSKKIWIIGVHSMMAKSTLLHSRILINNINVKLYANTHTDRILHGERVIIKDLPLWETNTLIENFLHSQEHIGEFSKVYMSKAKNNVTGAPSPFLNGDRYIFMNTNISPPLPSTVMLGDYTCRIWYRKQQQQPISTSGILPPTTGCADSTEPVQCVVASPGDDCKNVKQIHGERNRTKMKLTSHYRSSSFPSATRPKHNDQQLQPDDDDVSSEDEYCEVYQNNPSIDNR